MSEPIKGMTNEMAYPVYNAYWLFELRKDRISEMVQEHPEIATNLTLLWELSRVYAATIKPLGFDDKYVDFMQSALWSWFAIPSVVYNVDGWGKRQSEHALSLNVNWALREFEYAQALDTYS